MQTLCGYLFSYLTVTCYFMVFAHDPVTKTMGKIHFIFVIIAAAAVITYVVTTPKKVRKTVT